jgi:hypothetical protein
MKELTSKADTCGAPVMQKVQIIVMALTIAVIDALKNVTISDSADGTYRQHRWH